MQFDDLNNAKPLFSNWQHWVPFAALMVRESAPPNRPMTTRIIEQAFVALLAGGGSAYGVNAAVQAVHDEQIKMLRVQAETSQRELREQVRDSEIRLTAQIVELRQRQLK
ncbi:MAG: hypothetical protein ACYCZR_03770 [Burkholderiales bacterium]